MSSSPDVDLAAQVVADVAALVVEIEGLRLVVRNQSVVINALTAKGGVQARLIDSLKGRRAAVLELHAADSMGLCGHCGHTVPCPTVRAVEA